VVVAGSPAALPAAQRIAADQRRFLALFAVIVAVYYVAFGAAGVYPPLATAVGTLIPLVLAAAAWGLSRAGREDPIWLAAVTAAVSALALATAWLSARTACMGFHAVLALPLVYSVLFPHSFAAGLAGAAVSTAGGLALVLLDGHPPAQALQWGALAAAMSAVAAARITFARRALAAIRDEELAAAARVTASERHYRLLAENALDVIWTLDPTTARFTYLSPAIEAVLGYTPEEAFRRTLGGILTPGSLERVLTVLGVIGTPAEPPSISMTLDHVCRDGSLRTLEITGKIVRDATGRPVEVVGVSRDVSERRRLEAQVQEARRLEGIGRLAGGVAHDFNNLLTVILSVSSAMLEDLEGGVGVTAEDAREIRAAAERGRVLVQKLLAFARRQLVEPVLLDLGDAVAASAPLLASAAGDAVRVEVRREGGFLGVRCDRGGLDQALVHLAVNARDAMPAGGTLRVEVAPVQVAAGARLDGPPLTPGPWVRLRVEDSGTGMTPEARAHAFEPFFTTKPPGQGTGLGLATVHGVVAGCGGAVHLDSEPGRGTRLDLYFPHQPLPPARAPDDDRARPGNGGTVLVVEDDDVLRAVTVRILQGAGYRVLAAAGGREALARATVEAGPLHAAVLDVVMPGMSGVEVAAELRRVRPETALLYASGVRDGLALHRAADPAVPLLAKPFSPEALLAAIAERVRASGATAASPPP
jgi:PAS domain S-box-containing protein